LRSTSQFIAGDAAEVDQALLAVEMNTPGACGRSDDVLVSGLVELCLDRTTIYADDFESGTNSWTVSNSSPPTPYDWVQTTGPLPFARSGVAWFCDDPSIGDCGAQDESGSHSLQSPPIALPSGALFPMLTFTHYAGTEGGWDGGTVRVRVNSGSWQTVPRSAYQHNPYNGRLNTVAQGNTNPLAGEPSFTGAGGQWGTSLVDLSALASADDTLEVRFDFGKDGCTGVDGWYVDDFEVFHCPDSNADAEPDYREFFFTAASDVLAPIGDGSPQSFDILPIPQLPPVAGGDVRITFTARGDFSSTAEFIDVDINGTSVGSVFQTAAGDCPNTPEREEIVVTAVVFNAALAGGSAVINMVAPGSVNPAICDGDSYVTVLVEYQTTAPDCNSDGIPDVCQLAENDCNTNGQPDECDPQSSDIAWFVSQILADPPDSVALCLFDANLDGSLDGLDIKPFVESLVSP
jgi:hypothetical protein